VGKSFRAFDPHQVFLMRPSLDEWLPEGHLARFVAGLVDEVCGAVTAALLAATSHERLA
jgi:hypothetical protein